MKPVIVTAKNGRVVQSTRNANVGYIRVVQHKLKTGCSNAFIKYGQESALVLGSMKDLEALNWEDGQEIPGKIVTREQSKPFNTDPRYRHLDLKKDPVTDVVCKIGGQPIYRKNFYTCDLEASDVFIEHDNRDEIISARTKVSTENDTSTPI